MHSEDKRTTILVLKDQGHSNRSIAKTLRISRDYVSEVVRSGSKDVPPLVREEKAEPWHDDILELFVTCEKNLVRVHEELEKRGAVLSYQALTGYCRRHGIGFEPKHPAGRYHFEPGQEMQHDTSPHRVKIGDKVHLLQNASLVLAHSRMIYHQYYPTFNRFWCKVFLTEALRFFGGACRQCMIDNTHVVVSEGTGASMVPVPEMAAFAERFGFVFKAHEKGDANRSARVERPFSYIEGNFLAGREFKDWQDLNQQARAWCDMVNARPKRDLHACPRDLFALEQTMLKPLPIWIPTVYQLHHRIVDVEGFVSVHRNRYSVPWMLIGRRLEVRESQDRIEVFDGNKPVASHVRQWDPLVQRITDPEHRPKRGEGRPKSAPRPEESELLRLVPELAGYVAALKSRRPGRSMLMLRRLLGMARSYPRQPFLKAVASAQTYGLFDLDRLDRMILKNVDQDYFVLEEIPVLHLDPIPTEDSHER